MASFEIDQTPPALLIAYPADGAIVDAASSLVSGSTEPHARVFLSTADQQFELQADAAGGFSVAAVSLRVGPNTVIGHAVDRAGNVGEPDQIAVERRPGGSDLFGSLQ